MVNLNVSRYRCCLWINIFIELLCKASVILLSYYTPFNLGDLFVSVLMAQSGSFAEHPSFHVAHRKFEEMHAEFFARLKKVMQNSTTSFVIVTDGET
jgi:hypothetical protein